MAYLLPECPALTPAQGDRIRHDWERFSHGLPEAVETYLLETYQLDVSARYAGRPIRNPFGKASGQLALNAKQVETDGQLGLGFVVLKTVIAQDASGHQMMHEWAIHETRMQPEPIAGQRVGRLGWTITWKGRGWHESFESYLDFCRDSFAIAQEYGIVAAPSVKYHLPMPGEDAFRTEEYDFTTRALLEVWQGAGDGGPMPLEKDFSPTLAGDEKRSRQQQRVLEWLHEVPRLIRAAAPPGALTLGVKMMNTLFDDDFQVTATRHLADARPDFMIFANRLFDPQKEFEGKVGVAYGGPDLSYRNLLVLDRLLETAGDAPLPEISGTGDVCSGQMAVEYALRSCQSVQMHTLFQLPNVYYGMKVGHKTARTLHLLYFHPRTGLVPWLLHLRNQYGLGAGGVTRWLDVPQVLHAVREAAR